MPKGNRTNTDPGVKAASAARAKKHIKAVRAIQIWLEQPATDSNLTRRVLIQRYPRLISDLATEYAALVGIRPRTARGWIVEAMESK